MYVSINNKIFKPTYHYLYYIIKRYNIYSTHFSFFNSLKRSKAQYLNLNITIYITILVLEKYSIFLKRLQIYIKPTYRNSLPFLILKNEAKPKIFKPKYHYLYYDNQNG